MEYSLHGPPDPDIFLQEFRKIRTGIYDSPDDFFIKFDASESPSFEPVDQELWRECARSSTVTHFSLDRIYKALQTSKNCNHIWTIFRHIFSISRESKLELVCLIKPGLYPVPTGNKRVVIFLSWI
ncbi:hypothetical protein N7453_009670 [Penicillium expansum]|nr:hypothetical protein N7453_009670 [Penicillium expansum]